MASAQQPTVGRIVHYTGIFGGPPAPALILQVRDDVVDLLVWGLNRDDRVRAVHFDEDSGPRSWNWPARA